jgi:epoxyqueuosine reductase QueG
LSSTGYRRLVRGRALRRVDRAQLIRNAALCAGGERLARGAISPRLVAALERVASDLRHPIAAEAARWALDPVRRP